MSTSRLPTTSLPSATTCAAPAVSRRAFSTSLSATTLMRISRPARRWISSRLRASTFHVPPPTVPMPSSPTLIGFIAAAVYRGSQCFAQAITVRVDRSRGTRRGQQAVLAEHLLDAADRLAGAVLVLDQCEAHMRVAIVAEPDPGRYRDLGVGEKLLRELERTHLLVGFRDRRPDVHRGAGRIDHPARLVQPLHHHVAAPLVPEPDLVDARLGSFERDDRRDLDRREGPVVVVALDAGERLHHVGVADHEADAPAGHVVALRHREELDRDFARAGHLQDRRALVTVEHDVGVSEIVRHEDVVLSRK